MSGTQTIEDDKTEKVSATTQTKGVNQAECGTQATVDSHDAPTQTQTQTTSELAIEATTNSATQEMQMITTDTQTVITETTEKRPRSVASSLASTPEKPRPSKRIIAMWEALQQLECDWPLDDDVDVLA